jgi:elongation factor P--(R)-beta-lysine ligase
MGWWMPHQFDKKRDFLVLRARIISALRAFFDQRGFVAVETPALQICPTMDAHIHGFRTEFKGVDMKHLKNLYLHTSPEFDMKKLLVAGMPQIYQLCHVFRNGENTRLHSPEFSLLEWYRAGTDYTAMMQDCVDILRFVAVEAGFSRYSFGGKACDPFGEWRRISVAEAFLEYAEIDLDSCLDDKILFSIKLTEQGIRVIETDQWDDMFHAVMAEKIEPFLGIDTPCILYDYPASMAALSRRKPCDPRYAERFELYVCGVELANAFSELTDAAEQRARYETEMQAKQALYGETYPIDEEFLNALEFGMPESSGIALGADRLVMLATGAEHISQVLWAPVQT